MNLDLKSRVKKVQPKIKTVLGQLAVKVVGFKIGVLAEEAGLQPIVQSFQIRLG